MDYHSMNHHSTKYKGNTLAYIDATANAKGLLCEDNKEFVMKKSTPSSSLRRKHVTLSYHHVRVWIVSRILGYYCYEKLNPLDEISKKWKHWKIWNQLMSLLCYSGDTNDLIKPVEEWGEEAKIIVGSNKFNISTTTHAFQTIILALERPTALNALQLFDLSNTTSISDELAILVNTIVTQFQGIIPVCCKKGNN
jgi:hypothetical protein